MTTPTAPADIQVTVKNGYRTVVWNGVTYKDVDKSNTNAKKLPVALVTEMANYLISLGPANGRNFSQGDAKKYVAGSHSDNLTFSVVNGYTHTAKPPPTASPLPGEPSVEQGVTSVADFLKLLTNPALWLRVGEVLIGLLLLAVGAAELSGGAKTALKATPLRAVIH